MLQQALFHFTPIPPEMYLVRFTLIDKPLFLHYSLVMRPTPPPPSPPPSPVLLNLAPLTHVAAPVLPSSPLNTRQMSTSTGARPNGPNTVSLLGTAPVLQTERKRQRALPPSDSSEVDDDSDDEEPKKKRKVTRQERWQPADELALLRLVKKHRKAWKDVTRDFLQFQHRRTNETAETLKNKYKNLAKKQTKYNKPYPRKPWKITQREARKKTEEELQSLEAVHAENEKKNEEVWEEVGLPRTQSLRNANSPAGFRW